MLLDIIKKEILDNITSPKFVFTFLLCVILILLSMYTGINNYRAELKEFETGRDLNKENLESQTNYQVLAGFGTKINKQPQVLSTIISGIQQAVGRQATVNIAFDPSLIDSKYNSNPVYAIFGELDLTFIVKIVLSLFAILFTYDAIVGEKERGTLKLALTNSIPRYRIILGKAIGGFISLMLPLVIPLLLSLIMLNLYPDISLNGQDWGRIGLIFLLFLLYLSVFFTLGLFVSTRTSRSSTSLLVLLFIWVTFVTIIPKAAVMLAGQINPIPSVHEVTADKDAVLQEIQRNGQAEAIEWLQQNPNDQTPEWGQKRMDYFAELQDKLTTEIDDKNAQFEEEYQAKRRQQEVLAITISRISPASALTFGAMSFGKTGIDEHQRFLSTVKAYKRDWTNWINEKIFENVNLADPLAQPPPPELDDMPQFDFQPESIKDSLWNAKWDFVIMILFILLFFVGAYVSFLRYDVR